MLELGSSGSVRGVLSNEHPYREPGPEPDSCSAAKKLFTRSPCRRSHQRHRHCQSKRLRGLKIERQFKFESLIVRNIAGICARAEWCRCVENQAHSSLSETSNQSLG